MKKPKLNFYLFIDTIEFVHIFSIAMINIEARRINSFIRIFGKIEIFNFLLLSYLLFIIFIIENINVDIATSMLNLRYF